jgi:hypothetical protein
MNNSSLSFLSPPDCRKQSWQPDAYISPEMTSAEKAEIESSLWKTVLHDTEKAPQPPFTVPFFENATLIGFGCQWAVYLQKETQRVYKTSRYIFPFLGTRGYFRYWEESYTLTQQYLKPFLVSTTWHSVVHNNMEIYYLEQPYLNAHVFETVDSTNLSDRQRSQLNSLAHQLLSMLADHGWLPDLNISRIDLDGVSVWQLQNTIWYDNRYQIIDIAAPYDVFCLYPERAIIEVASKKADLKAFVVELHK